LTLRAATVFGTFQSEVVAQSLEQRTTDVLGDYLSAVKLEPDLL
jgi:hypothetical protein